MNAIRHAAAINEQKPALTNEPKQSNTHRASKTKPNMSLESPAAERSRLPLADLPYGMDISK